MGFKENFGEKPKIQEDKEIIEKMIARVYELDKKGKINLTPDEIMELKGILLALGPDFNIRRNIEQGPDVLKLHLNQ